MWYHTCLVAESVEVIGWCVWHHMAICKVSGVPFVCFVDSSGALCLCGWVGVGGGVEVRHGGWGWWVQSQDGGTGLKGAWG